METEPIESLRRELVYSADTDGAIKRIDSAATLLGTECLAEIIVGNLDQANWMVLGLKTLNSAIEFLDKTRYGLRGGDECGKE